MLKYEVRHPLGLRVKAYRNLHGDSISLMDNKGRVIKHVQRALLQVEKFHVREAGMLKAYNAFKEGRKSEKFPHAFIIGYVAGIDDEFEMIEGKGARYNPKDGKAHFVTLDGQPLYTTEFAVVEALPEKKSRIYYDVRARLKLKTDSARLHSSIMWPHFGTRNEIPSLNDVVRFYNQ